MEVVDLPAIVSTYRHALHTFDDKHKNNLQNNLRKLKSMMDDLKAEDLGFDLNLCDPDFWKTVNKAPCTYIEVFRNKVVSMSIFVLKPGFKMPLHDHPEMHGLLKMIAGAACIKSFTECSKKEALNSLDFTTNARHLPRAVRPNRQIYAKVSQHSVFKADSETCTLTPTISNYHEIQALNEPAAFFDILSPPYDSEAKKIRSRICRFYCVANEITSNVVELLEIDVPKYFYCDQAKYSGPPLS